MTPASSRASRTALTEGLTKLTNDSCLLTSFPHSTHRRIVNLFGINLAARDNPAAAAKGGNQQNLLLFSGAETYTSCTHSKSILVIDCLLLWLLPLGSSFSD